MKKFFYSTISNNIVPKVVYANADTDKVKIINDNRGLSCVYRWINKVNGKLYIGSSMDLSVRMYKYYSLAYLAQSNRAIDRALLKYGFSQFSLEILEYCDKDTVIQREQYYIDTLNPEYNIVKKAGSTLGYKHTTESLERMRNFVLSAETIEKKIEAVSKASAANRIPIIVQNINTKESIEYSSMAEGGEALGVHKNTISNAIKNNRIVQKEFVCKLKNENLTVETEVSSVLSELRLKIKKGETSKKKVLVVNIKTKESTEYSSMTEAGEVLNVNKSTIGKAIKNKSIMQGSFICILMHKNEDIVKKIDQANAQLEELGTRNTNKVKVLVENIKTGEKIEYSSKNKAAEALGIDSSNLGKAINKKSIIKKTYICYLDNKPTM